MLSKRARARRSHETLTATTEGGSKGLRIGSASLMAVFSGNHLRWTPKLLALDAVIPADECVLVGGSVSRSSAERERVS